MPVLIINWLLKHWLPIAAVIAAVLALAWFSHARYAAGEAAGEARVLEEWHEAQQAQAAAYEAQVKATMAQIEADREAARRIENELRVQIATADGTARDLARRLRDYQARRCGGPVPAAAGAAGEPAGTAGVAATDAEIERTVEDYYAACGRDAARLNAWGEWWASVSR